MVSRRDATALISALGFGATAPHWSTKAHAAAHSLPTDPVEQNESWVRIIGRTDDGESIWRVSLRFFAITGDGVIPFLQTRGAMRYWWRREDENVYRRFVSTANYFIDPESGAFIDEFTNPLTGRVTKLETITGRRRHGQVFTPSGSYHPETRERFPDMYDNSPLSLDWRIEADTVRVFETVHFPPVVQQPMLEVHSYAAPAAEALDRSRNSAQATTAGWFTARFRPRLDMDDVDGYLLWHSKKTKVNGLGDLDDDYLTHTRANIANFDISPEFDEGSSYLDQRLSE